MGFRIVADHRMVNKHCWTAVFEAFAKRKPRYFQYQCYRLFHYQKLVLRSSYLLLEACFLTIYFLGGLDTESTNYTWTVETGSYPALYGNTFYLLMENSTGVNFASQDINITSVGTAILSTSQTIASQTTAFATTTFSTTLATTSGLPASPLPSTGLGTSDKIALGVGISCGILLITLIVLVVALLRKGNGRRHIRPRKTQKLEIAGNSEVIGSRHELPGAAPPVHELAARGPIYEMHS